MRPVFEILAVASLVVIGGGPTPQSALAEEPAAELDGGERPGETGATTSVWDGVYTGAQARRGEEVYPGPCGRCHGARLNGAPDDPDMFPTRPIAGAKFLRDWNGRSLAALFEYMRSTMPENNPSYLSDREYTDLLAYMLFVSGAPPGSEALRSEPKILSGIQIRKQP